MTSQEVMKQLQKMGNKQTKSTWQRHGCPEPFWGVKVGDMKTIIKKIKIDTPLAKELYRTGNSDAMYFAGLIADGKELTKNEINEWAKKATWQMLSEYTVAFVATEHPQGWEIGLEWIDSKDEKISSAGWNTLASILSCREDKDLDLKGIEKLLDRAVKTIGKAPNRTRYTMNGFVIATGSHVKPLTAKAMAAASKLGKVEVDVGETSCKVPLATDYINKVKARGSIGKKRKFVKC